jgi:hypothetical protein
MLHFLFIQKIHVLNILNMLHTLRFFLFKMCLFHNATFFGSCIIHILNTGVLKFKRKSRRQRVKQSKQPVSCRYWWTSVDTRRSGESSSIFFNSGSGIIRVFTWKVLSLHAFPNATLQPQLTLYRGESDPRAHDICTAEFNVHGTVHH